MCKELGTQESHQIAALFLWLLAFFFFFLPVMSPQRVLLMTFSNVAPLCLVALSQHFFPLKHLLPPYFSASRLGARDAMRVLFPVPSPTLPHNLTETYKQR